MKKRLLDQRRGREACRWQGEFCQRMGEVGVGRWSWRGWPGRGPLIDVGLLWLFCLRMLLLSWVFSSANRVEIRALGG